MAFSSPSCRCEALSQRIQPLRAMIRTKRKLSFPREISAASSQQQHSIFDSLDTTSGLHSSSHSAQSPSLKKLNFQFLNVEEKTVTELCNYIASGSKSSFLGPPPAAVRGLLVRLLDEKSFQKESVRGFRTKVGEKKSWKVIDPIKSAVKSSKPGSSEAMQEILRERNHRLKGKLAVAYLSGMSQENGSETKGRSFWRSFVFYGSIGLVGVFVYYILVGEQFPWSMARAGREVEQDAVKQRFQDVKGAEEAKEELQDVVKYLKNPERYSRLGGRLPNGVLLVGPPGTGKTMLARAVAGESDAAFFAVSGPEFDEMFVGVGAKRVRALFQEARASAPAVLFIDEIDSIGGKRTSSSLYPHANQSINQLLSEMDGFETNDMVVVIGATNRVADLDPALLRPGRFDVQVQVSLPTHKERVEILDFYLKSILCAADVDAEQLAIGTVGMSGADLENLVNQAAVKAAGDGLSEVNQAALKWARQKVAMGPEKKTRIQSEKVTRNTAFHEAGHTIVAFFTRHAKTPNTVTVIPRGLSLGHTELINTEDSLVQSSRSELLAHIDVCMGGRAAEELIFGPDEVTAGGASDFVNATTIARSMVKEWGMSDKVGPLAYRDDTSNAMNDLLEAEVKRIVQESYERTKTLLTSKAKLHHKLAEALIKEETLNQERITALLTE